MTAAGKELRPIVEAAGAWGQRWVTTEATLLLAGRRKGPGGRSVHH
ncbi:hypothetical protein [uncultured Castellaniella sp.]|nr:hypothetical protein [uncultured Castellaniella sp.]